MLRAASAAPAGSTPRSHYADESPAPPHPYPGWTPTGAGDPNALLAWIDHDLKGHDAVLDEPPRKPTAYAAHEDEGNGFGVVKTGTGVIDHASAIKETGEVVHHIAHGVPPVASPLVGLLAPLGIVNGIMGVLDGKSEIEHGHTADGVAEIDANVLGTGASALALAGYASEAARVSAPVLGLGALGAEAVHYGDGKVKDLGWLHDGGGHAESVSEWSGDLAASADRYFTDRGHPLAGAVAGAVTCAGTSIAGTGISLAGAPIGAGHAIGDGLANHHRASLYADRFAKPQGGAQGFADYDDAQAAAVERSKREHPERWGNNPNNLTPPQAFAQLQAIAAGEKGTQR